VESVPKLDSNNRPILQEYISHDPIYAGNDEQLADVANSGTGSVCDPYIIAGWYISGSQWYVEYGIHISQTSKHFRIENCRVDDCNTGIDLYHVSSGTATLTNNICTYNSLYGIHLLASGFSNLSTNLCQYHKSLPI
jgi:parallel beta-helix repeat protein